jgi:hypothetical protein
MMFRRRGEGRGVHRGGGGQDHPALCAETGEAL